METSFVAIGETVAVGVNEISLGGVAVAKSVSKAVLFVIIQKSVSFLVIVVQRRGDGDGLVFFTVTILTYGA